MKLYEVDEEYIQFLRGYDSKILFNKEKRKYVGILLKVGFINYFAPLTSPKAKHIRYTSSLKMVLLFAGKQHIGSVLLNNMIPVFDMHYVKKINVADYINDKDIERVKYGKLLAKQIKVIMKQEIKSELLRKANAVYQYHLKEKDENIVNFKKLEKVLSQQKLIKKLGSPLGTTFKL